MTRRRAVNTSRYARKPESLHPGGFRVFLPASQVAESDEYADADPYRVEAEMTSAFHQRRLAHTIDLVHRASAQHPASRILDLGCGEGHITAAIKRAFPAYEVSGLDYSVSAVAKAHRAFPDVEFVVGDARDLPYVPSYFDIVVCNNLWEHVPDPLLLLANIKGILAPAGCVIISTPSRYRTGNLARVLLGKPVRFMSSRHVTEYTVGQVKEQLRFGGFTVEDAYAKPIPAGRPVIALARLVFGLAVGTVRSHHLLESTIFYLARRDH